MMSLISEIARRISVNSKLRTADWKNKREQDATFYCQDSGPARKARSCCVHGLGIPHAMACTHTNNCVCTRWSRVYTACRLCSVPWRTAQAFYPPYATNRRQNSHANHVRFDTSVKINFNKGIAEQRQKTADDFVKRLRVTALTQR
jgi:hypothetical protein